jgi:hypothetical protein
MGTPLTARVARRRSVLTFGLKESQHMQPRITIITIGVDDLERVLRFYRDGLGLATEGIIGKCKSLQT